MPAETFKSAKGHTAAAVLILVIFIVGTFAPTWIQSTQWYTTLVSDWPYEPRVLAKPISRMLILLLGTWCLLGIHPKQLPKALTLTPGLRKLGFGIVLGTLFSLPLLIVGALGGISDALQLRSLPYNSLGPGIFEELFFRAFAFGLLVRLAHWRIWPAAIFTAIFFALAHLHIDRIQSLDLSGQLIELFMITGSGAFYAWLYAKWKFNIYLPITMHTLLDLCWQLFNMDQSPLGTTGLITATAMVFIIPTIITISISRKARSSRS